MVKSVIDELPHRLFFGAIQIFFGAMFTPNELVFTFGTFYVCANFGENPLRNASVRVHADGHEDRGKLVL